MPGILCPACGSRAAGANFFWGWEKPYCSLCGWNIPAAIESQRSQLRQFRGALYIAAVFFVLLAFFKREPSTLIVFLFLLAVLLSICLFTLKKLKTLTALEQSSASSAAALIAAKEKTRLERTAALEQLRALPKPRRVRMRIVPRIISLLFPLSWVFIVFVAYQLLADNGQTGAVFPDNGLLLILLLVPAGWTAICVWTLARARRDRRLLAEGEVTLATIISQWMAGSRHPLSKVAYEFKDSAGHIVQSEVTDSSRSLYEQMQTWIFYDPLNSEKQVLEPNAYCQLQKD
jgi:hypothetical protein